MSSPYTDREDFSEATTLKLEVEEEPAEQRSWRRVFQANGITNTKALMLKELGVFEEQGERQCGHK